MGEEAKMRDTGQPMGISHRWEECTWPEIKGWAERGAVVVVPAASTEQHGPHLPLCTDALILTSIAEQAVAKASRTVPVLLAPTLTIGCSQHHMRFPGTLSIGDVTFVDMATQVGLSIVAHGFRHLIFLNGHGGNRAPLELAVARIHAQTCDVLCALASYWSFLRGILEKERRSAPGGIGHACEFETAAVMALRPDLVRPDRPPPSCGKGNGYWSTDWYEHSMVSLGFSVDELSSSGVLGDPAMATAEAGARWVSIAAAKIAQFIIAFRGWKRQHLRVGGEDEVR